MSTDVKKKNPVTPEGRVSYPCLFQPRAFGGDENKPKKYSVVLLFPKSVDLSAFEKLVEEAAKAKWGKDVPKKLKRPICDGNQEEGDEYQDTNFIRLSSNEDHPPKVVGPDKKPLDPKDLYPGCWGRASIRAYAWEFEGVKGVNFGVVNFQKTRDDEPFGSTSDPDEDFDEVSTGSDSADDDFFGEDVPF